MLKEGKMYLHAPVKLAMFYATNPFVLPISGVIGVTRSLCMGCDAFLQLAQSSDGLFNTAQTGPPIELSYVLTAAIPDPTFLFPNLNTCLDTRQKLPPLERERIQTRLDLISRRMSDEIRKGVGGMLLKLYAPIPHTSAPGDSQTQVLQGDTQFRESEYSAPDTNPQFVPAGDDGTSAAEQTSDEDIIVPPADETDSSTTILGRAEETFPQSLEEHNVKIESENASLKHKKGSSEPKKLRERLKRWGLWKNMKNEHGRR
ncbi:hypothetical protein BDQ17DRAFT_1354754 [Cyathus striatus]|nr:hypothetical protein BDQ17DRAFT_1354754 [Cyathus striatus]